MTIMTVYQSLNIVHDPTYRQKDKQEKKNPPDSSERVQPMCVCAALIRRVRTPISWMNARQAYVLRTFPSIPLITIAHVIDESNHRPCAQLVILQKPNS